MANLSLKQRTEELSNEMTKAITSLLNDSEKSKFSEDVISLLSNTIAFSLVNSNQIKENLSL